MKNELRPGKMRHEVKPGDVAVFRPPGGKAVWHPLGGVGLIREGVQAAASNTVQRLMGFWLCWHAMGGDHAMREAGWAVATIRKNRADFRELYGVTVEDWRLTSDEAARILEVLGIDVGALAALLPAAGTQLPLIAG